MKVTSEGLNIVMEDGMALELTVISDVVPRVGEVTTDEVDCLMTIAGQVIALVLLQKVITRKIAICYPLLAIAPPLSHRYVVAL